LREEGDLRLLVLDGSRVLPSLVRRLAPEDVDIEVADEFDRAVAILTADPPDAVIANVGPSDLPWQELKSFCENHSPTIPVLFESCVYPGPNEAGLDSLNNSAYFLAKPYPLDDLRRAIRLLIRWVEKSDRPPETSSG
jgi:DNA-binding response OmpR family regulator